MNHEMDERNECYLATSHKLLCAIAPQPLNETQPRSQFSHEMPDTKYALMATAIALCFMKHEIESAGSH
jgi:hypothetical protein